MTYDGIAPHAPRTDVLKAMVAAQDVNTDLIITVGGGSVTDAGKVIALGLKPNMLSHEDFEVSMSASMWWQYSRSGL